MASPQHVSRWLLLPRLRLLGGGWCGVWLALGVAHGAEFESWSKVEQAPETSDYGQVLREGKFGPEQANVVRQTFLPQLGLESNRAAIASVRQRIRDVALRGATKKEVIDDVNAVIRDGMAPIAADKNEDPVVRVNAMLLVGELQDLDRSPWPGSVEELAKAAADASLPLAVRVAALQGLARHLAGAGGTGAAATAAAPVVAALVSTPPTGDPIAVRWLLSRALDLLPAVPAPPAAIAAAARILGADQADTDLRVRAAIALGKLAKPEAGIDAAAAVAQIKALAIAALAADLDAAEARRLDRKLAGAGRPTAGAEFGGARPGPPPLAPRAETSGGSLYGGPPGGEFGGGDLQPAVVDEDAVPTLACRRNAWRLSGLAEALQPARGGAGLVGLLQGDPAEVATDLATTMRQWAMKLDATPDEETLSAAREAIDRLAAAAGPAAAENKPAGQPKPAATPSPFDEPTGN